MSIIIILAIERGFFLPGNWSADTLSKTFISKSLFLLLCVLGMNFILYFNLSSRIDDIDDYSAEAKKDYIGYCSRDEQFRNSIFNAFDLYDKEIKTLKSDLRTLKNQNNQIMKKKLDGLLLIVSD